MCDRCLLLSLPSSAPSLRCGCLPIHWDTGFHPSTSEVSDSGGQEVRGLCDSFHPVTLQPSCCLRLYVQKLDVRSVCSSWGKPEGGGGALGKPQGRSSTCYSCSCFIGENTVTHLCLAAGKPGRGLLSRERCLRRAAGRFGGD